MASRKFKETELVNEAGDTRTATSPAQFAQLTFDGYAKPEPAEASDGEKAEAKIPAAGKSTPSGGTAAGERTVGSNPS